MVGIKNTIKIAFIYVQFQLIMNVAVGAEFSPDSLNYDHARPWGDNDHQLRSLWERRGEWPPTGHGENVAMAIDYVEKIQY